MLKQLANFFGISNVKKADAARTTPADTTEFEEWNSRASSGSTSGGKMTEEQVYEEMAVEEVLKETGLEADEEKAEAPLAIQVMDPFTQGVAPAAITRSGKVITSSPYQDKNMFIKGNMPEIPKLDKVPETDQEIWDAVELVIEKRIRPMIQSHEGDAHLEKIENGVVTVKLTGTCVGCAMSMVTLRYGVEKDIKSVVPQIQRVEAILGF